MIREYRAGAEKMALNGEKGSLETSLTRLLPEVFHKCSVEYLCNVLIDHK